GHGSEFEGRKDLPYTAQFHDHGTTPPALPIRSATVNATLASTTAAAAISPHAITTSMTAGVSVTDSERTNALTTRRQVTCAAVLPNTKAPNSNGTYRASRSKLSGEAARNAARP